MEELDNYFNQVTEKAHQPKKSKSRWLKWYLVVSLAVFCLLAGFGGGVYWLWQAPQPGEPNIQVELYPPDPGEVFNTQGTPDYLRQDVDFDIFWDVWQLVQTKFVNQPVLDTELFYGSLKGLVASLGDPYSVFLDPKTTSEFNQELSGSFEGIGAEIGLREGQLTIVAPLDNSPAQKAGLHAGDKVMAIDGFDTTGISIEYAVSIIRGPQSSQVTLTVVRDDPVELQDIVITRGKIVLDSIKWKMVGVNEDIVHLEVKYFNFDTTEKFNEAVQAILAKKPKGIILDLRNNPGGLLGTAIDVASEWVGREAVLFEKNFEGEIKKYDGSGLARLRPIKTVVLINGGSASGAEIVAGALQDYKISTLAGETTFGKGSVQNLESMKDGSSVKLTTAYWLTPDKRAIEGEGIVPDVEVERTLEDYDAGLDPQIDKALELLEE